MGDTGKSATPWFLRQKIKLGKLTKFCFATAFGDFSPGFLGLVGGREPSGGTVNSYGRGDGDERDADREERLKTCI